MNDRIVRGKYKVDRDTFRVFDDNENRIYEIDCNNCENWASIKVGDYTHMGLQLTQEDYNRLKSECYNYGSFVIYD